ncbi:ParB N-terminal domain-containing protein [Flavobacterium caseinilyticum]|uniref:Uncharacterized protein n=1 Tax=Flavobacterium caseinilyticum TaxID=2541732 RepID=A0A4R5AVM1_9FLAO|nr:ParB N-terminal domain-containing protein [Flavobacterium caseinilyticum]TDD77151.1 hypothetical protein E0F89_06005 [Flavobacterium caseinilyticum]
MEIQQTTNYELFENITGNRLLSKSKIEKIINDVTQGFNMLPFCPIIVSEKDGLYCIIDGQHRYEISKQTGNPVYFVVCNTLTLKQIAQLNSRGEKWKPNDFLNCYIKLGITDYEKIIEIMNKHKIAIKLSIDLLMYNNPKVKSTETFQSGGFECKYFEETDALLTLSDELFGQYRFSKDRNLIGAVQELQKKGLCSFEKLKSKISQAPMLMDRQASVKLYMYNIEKVYNHKNQTREVIM